MPCRSQMRSHAFMELRRPSECATSPDHPERLGRGVFPKPASTRRSGVRVSSASHELDRLREHFCGGMGVFSNPVGPRRAKMRAITTFRHRPPRVHSVCYQATLPDFVGPPGPHATERAEERIVEVDTGQKDA